MSDANLVDRLAALPTLTRVPREELEWLAAHGDIQLRSAGVVVAPKGQRIENLLIILSGHISVRVDRGVGPRRVIGWRTGEVTGMLPYSRMKGPPGDNIPEEDCELLAIHESHFSEMVHRCPEFTAYTVHLMLDRARRFNASDMQEEKMISLGKLAAGLAHELNNPASATASGAGLLMAALDEVDAASRALGAVEITDELRKLAEQARDACLARRADDVLSPIEYADREDEIGDWLTKHQCDPEYAERLAGTAVQLENLEELAQGMSADKLDAVLRWIAVRCETHSLAADIKTAASRIHELVAAVKSFTQMDHLAGPEAVDVEMGLRDTIRVIASKARAKGAAITLDVEDDLPRVYATGGELNQIWMNLIDNALDASTKSGRIEISARRELDNVVVRVVDDGPGIPPEIEPQIFDAFFTTKPPGEGTGLGLEITRRLVRRYHGDIAVDSRPGRTEFRVSLAMEQPAAVD